MDNKQVGGNHYKNMTIEPMQYIVANNLDWFDGNAIKYVSRHKSKNGKTDLEKAIHYIELAIKHNYETTEVPAPTKFKVGDKVVKTVGDVKFPGEIRAVYKTISGEDRIVVECTVPLVRGLQHIYRPDQFEFANEVW